MNNSKFQSFAGSLRIPDTVMEVCEEYEPDQVRSALRGILELPGIREILKKGTKAAVKVNLVSGVQPEKAATVHPEVIRQLSILLQEMGVEAVFGDSPGGLYTREYVRMVYRACALTPLEKEGVRLNDDFSVKEGVFEEALSIRTFEYTGWLDQADVIINLCKLKTHAMMNMSCCVKNLYGTVPGVTKPEYHMRFPDPARFADMMVDLNEYFCPVLQIVDAVVGMEGNGPTAGKPVRTGLMIGGRSPYYTDALCARLIGMPAAEVPTLEAAARRWKIRTEELVHGVQVSGSGAGITIPPYETAAKKLSVTFGRDTFFGRISSGALKKILSVRPVPDGKECIGCAKCAKICPAGAIRMINRIPSIDRRKCIRCFCCQEFCPKGAMKAGRNPLGMLISRLNHR